jgi:hypothetical protein
LILICQIVFLCPATYAPTVRSRFVKSPEKVWRKLSTSVFRPSEKPRSRRMFPPHIFRRSDRPRSDSLSVIGRPLIRILSSSHLRNSTVQFYEFYPKLKISLCFLFCSKYSYCVSTVHTAINLPRRWTMFGHSFNSTLWTLKG